ncbi:MAG: hypothetical protein P4M11_14170 [Candidatus Pacebacteria bacterium]|nr:hypothetical protein [Candidatus Paceibacterota bacterium]
MSLCRLQLQADLERSLCEVFDRNPDLNYVQGFNDIVGTMLLVLGPEHVVAGSESVARHYIKYL